MTAPVRLTSASRDNGADCIVKGEGSAFVINSMPVTIKAGSHDLALVGVEEILRL